MDEMEYVFGLDEEEEILKTKGLTDDVLSGYVEIVREYPDQNILDRFHIKERRRSVKFDEFYYNWYVIDKHYRSLDKTPPAKRDIEANKEMIFGIEDAMCELDLNDMRIDAIEDALCELDSKGAM